MNDNGNFGICLFRGQRCVIGRRHNDIHPQPHQLGHEGRVLVDPSLGKATLDDDILALDKPALAQAIQEGLARRLFRDSRVIRQKPNAIDFPGLLRTGRERPQRRAANRGYQFSPSDCDWHVPLPCEGSQ